MDGIRVRVSVEYAGRRLVGVVEDYSFTGKWRFMEFAGSLEAEKGRGLRINVEEGAARGFLGALRGGRLRALMEAARLLSCMLGVPVELRVHGLRVARVECRD